ncbi:MAG: hypothetical protein P4M09_29075 [Devosia sp.]|nr:hypothetical protein [Devosia sp.]
MLKSIIQVTIVAAGLAVGFAASAYAQTPVAIGETAKGKTLTDAKGMTLYVFDKDATPGKSVCNGACATNWPPVAASAADKAGDGYTVIVRDDGSKQWAHNNKPLYRFIKDKKPGDIVGDGFLNGAWHVAQP